MTDTPQQMAERLEALATEREYPSFTLLEAADMLRSWTSDREWRGWVTFVFIDGPHEQLSDKELRAGVCAKWDALQAKIREATHFARELHDSGDCGQMLHEIVEVLERP